jgi:hypothetical protein
VSGDNADAFSRGLRLSPFPRIVYVCANNGYINYSRAYGVFLDIADGRIGCAMDQSDTQAPTNMIKHNANILNLDHNHFEV